MLYTFRAVDQAGKPSSGEREAASERELADVLRHEGLFLLEAGSREAARLRLRVSLLFSGPFGRVSLVERMTFARNLAVMIGAGLPLARALEALALQSKNQRFKRILAAVREGIMKGKTFAESLRPHEGAFGHLFINMVEAGEISGNLERVLKILARQMSRDHELRSRVRGAMLYPAVVVGALVVIGILMMVYVVPTLTTTFQELGVALPLSTRIILAISHFLLVYYVYASAGAAVVALLFVRLLRTPGGKSVFDALVLRLPVFGPLLQKLNSARFSRTLSSLISSGIPITRALEVTATVLGNVHFRHTLETAASAIQKGSPLHEILASRADIFPAMVTQMIQVGEETGTTSRMLLRLAIFYEGEVATTTKNLSSLIEPLLMLVIGGAVGFFAISMIQPIYSGVGNL